MNKYNVVSENDNIDAECFGVTLAGAVSELLHLNGYTSIIETDWSIDNGDQLLVIDGYDL